MEKLKERIINKFGSLSEFCRLAMISRGSLDHYLRNGEQDTLRSKAMGLIIKSAIRKQTTENGLIQEDDRERLRRAIIADYDGSVKLFADVHGFDVTNVHYILNEKRKTKTDIVNQILKVTE